MYDKLILLHINRILNKLDNNLVNIIKIYIFSNRIPKKLITNYFNNKKSYYINSNELFISKFFNLKLKSLSYEVIFVIRYDGKKNIIKELGKNGRLNSIMKNYEKNNYYKILLSHVNNFKWTEIHWYGNKCLRKIYENI